MVWKSYTRGFTGGEAQERRLLQLRRGGGRVHGRGCVANAVVCTEVSQTTLRNEVALGASTSTAPCECAGVRPAIAGHDPLRKYGTLHPIYRNKQFYVANGRVYIGEYFLFRDVAAAVIARAYPIKYILMMQKLDLIRAEPARGPLLPDEATDAGENGAPRASDEDRAAPHTGAAARPRRLRRLLGAGVTALVAAVTVVKSVRRG